MSSTIDLAEDIRTLVAEVLEEEPENIKDDAEFVKELGMDSMMALEILAAVEKKYHISVPEEMLPKFTNLNKTVRIVNEIIEKKK